MIGSIGLCVRRRKPINRKLVERSIMSKYNSLWEYIQKNGSPSFKMTFEEIQNIAGRSIDHSFLKYKKELTEYGYEVGKISMKEQTVIFNKVS